MAGSLSLDSVALETELVTDLAFKQGPKTPLMPRLMQI